MYKIPFYLPQLIGLLSCMLRTVTCYSGNSPKKTPFSCFGAAGTLKLMISQMPVSYACDVTAQGPSLRTCEALPFGHVVQHTSDVNLCKPLLSHVMQQIFPSSTLQAYSPTATTPERACSAITSSRVFEDPCRYHCGNSCQPQWHQRHRSRQRRGH